VDTSSAADVSAAHVLTGAVAHADYRAESLNMQTSEPRTLLTHPELKSHQSLPVFKTLGEPPKSRLERLLSIFADVRSGEGVGTLLLAVNIFLLLAGYSLMKPARDGLILTEGGAELASYSAAAQAVLLMAVVPLYGWLGTRVGRIRLISIMMTFFSATLVGFYLGGQAGLREGVAFYIWIGLINVFIVSQFWAFANDIYTEGQGRRLFPLVGVGQSLGAWVGAAAVTPLVQGLNYTPYTLMFLGACVLMMALGITLVVNRRETARAEPEAAATNAAPLGPEGGFELVWKDRYLLWIAVLIVLLNVVNTTGGYVLNRLIVQEAVARFGTDPSAIPATRQFVTAFSGSIIATVNLVGFLLQLFVTSRVIRFMGVRGALFILPVLALVNYSIIAVAPILAVVRIGKILENSTDYSIQNTLRQALFLPTSREAKYKAKAAIDTFFTRGGDVLSAAFVGVGQATGLGVPAFAGLNVALTGVWLWVAGQIAREHRKKTV
jgi:ATP:ADP antiporter, AAA family